jgi:hypothetical protein
MSITFDKGYSISKPTTGVTMRSLLSAAGQATYDAATVGNFFSCSLADYNAVFAGYADAQKIGMTDTIFNTALGSAYTGTCASVLPQANSTIPSNTYILGFAAKLFSATSATFTPLISTTYKGTYTAISNSPSVSTGNRTYYLRKDPPITSVNSYVGHVTTAGASFDQATTSYSNAGFDCAAPYDGWTNRNGTMPHFQMFVTTTKPY